MAVLIPADSASAQTTPTPTSCWDFENGFDSTTNAAFDGIAGEQADGYGPNDAATVATNPSPAGGSSLTLDGDGDYLWVGNPMPASGSYTKTMWVYRRTAGNVDGTWENLYTSGDAGGPHALNINSDDRSLQIWHRGEGTGIAAYSTGAAVASAQWVHVAVAHDSAADSITTYLDGVAVDTVTGVGALGTMVNEDTIGSYAGMQTWFNGQLDDVCIYGSALTAAQVAALANTATASTTCTFAGAGGAIADGDPFGGLVSTIDIALDATIESLELAWIDAAHPNVGQLTGLLESPNPNLFVSVMNEPANADDSDLDGTYVFSDNGRSLFDAATAVGSDEAIPAGTYRASRSDTDSEDLDDQFIGMSTQGTWTVTIADNVDGDVGTVGSVELRITISGGTCPTSTLTCNGLAVTIDLSGGGGGVGTAGDDVILGSSGPDTIDGGDGDDTICGGGGNDTLTGGNGNDTLLGESGDDKLFGLQGIDTIHGGAGDDVIHGNRGNDVLNGNDGADRIFGYAHDDTIDGGPGDDRLHGNFGNDTITGGPGADRIFGYGDDDTMSGGAGNDLITGNFGDDTIDGGDDDDVLYGADGDDIVSGGAGNDQVNGNSLNDVLNGGPGDDTLDGGINNDTCHGDGGNDTATRCETVTGVP